MEVGPGRGALTALIAARAGRVIGVELDGYLATQLEARQLPDTMIVHGDFLDYSLPGRDYKLIGNLPYAVTTDIVHKVTTTSHAPREAWFVVQREAAHRFIGRPFRNETRWSLRLKPWWHVEIVEHLARRDFDPPPRVESVMIWLARRDPALVNADHEAGYRELIDVAFQSGDSAGTSLKRFLTRKQIQRLAADLRFDLDDRPPKLCFEQWLGILRFVTRT